MSKSPENIEINSRWKDGWGEKVTVIEYDGYRVLFLRYGYEHPCRMTGYRFMREFTYLPDDSEKHQEEAKAKGREKIAAIRSKLPLKGRNPK
ncbi:DUF4222 domain-containing protein [Enterobacter ludwigii]